MMNRYLLTKLGVDSVMVSDKTRFTDGRSTAARATTLTLLTQLSRVKRLVVEGSRQKFGPLSLVVVIVLCTTGTIELSFLRPFGALATFGNLRSHLIERNGPIAQRVLLNVNFQGQSEVIRCTCLNIRL